MNSCRPRGSDVGLHDGLVASALALVRHWNVDWARGAAVVARREQAAWHVGQLAAPLCRHPAVACGILPLRLAPRWRVELDLCARRADRRLHRRARAGWCERLRALASYSG